MQKLAPSVGRLAVIAIFSLSCFGLLLFLWISFGGSVPLEAKGYRFNIVFPQSNQLAQQADVRISGVTVGTVVGLNPTPQGQTVATIQMQPRYAPVHADARAILRAKTLLGETFVAITPGSRSAPAIPDGGTLGAGRVAESVQLDEIYRTFDPKTRAAFQTWFIAQAAGVHGQGPALNAALGELDPFVNDLEQVTATLQSQNGAVGALVRNTGIVFDALAERENQLRDLVTTSNATFGAIAAASNELATAFTLLPTFETRSQAAFRRLDQFAANTSPLLRELAPAEVALTPVLRNLQTLSPSLEHLLVGLGPLTTASKAGLPALDDVLAQLRPLLGALSPVLRNLIPLIAYAELYRPELQAFLANSAAASQQSTNLVEINSSSTASLHFARALLGPANPSSFALQSGQPYGFSRANGYTAPGAFNQLATGLPTLDPATCSNPTPGVSGPPNSSVSQRTLDLITVLGMVGTGSNGNVPAPPCVGSAPLSFAGLSSTFPHVLAPAN